MRSSFLHALALTVPLVACSSDVETRGEGGGGAGTSGSVTSASPSSGPGTSSVGPDATIGAGAAGPSVTTGSGGAGGEGGAGGGGGPGGGGAGGGGPIVEPTTCEEAARGGSSLGCEHWPTITPNIVWSIFDFAIVVANPQTVAADVTVEQGGAVLARATVAPGAAETLYLSWDAAQKGPDAGSCGEVGAVNESGVHRAGAFRVASSVPVSVSQWSPIEHDPSGGPPGKDWSACPGLSCALDCNAFTADASLLLPTSGLGTSYRVVGWPSWTAAGLGQVVTLVGVEDGTEVTVSLGVLGGVQAGDGVEAAGPGDVFDLTLGRGDVVQLVATVLGTDDLSGTSIEASAPVQVLTGIACAYVPTFTPGCDHLEESLLPASALGRRTVLARPTGPDGQPASHVVRMVGHVDGTILSYPAGAPPGAPSQLEAGQVVDLSLVNVDFVVEASEPVAIATFLPGGDVEGQTDPSQSFPLAVEHMKRRHLLRAPADWPARFVDVVHPEGAAVLLDGAPAVGPTTTIGLGYDVTRVPLPAGGDGVHLVEADAPISVQVLGHGEFASFQLPAGVALP